MLLLHTILYHSQCGASTVHVDTCKGALKCRSVESSI
jgi:hypothetical protein